LLRESVGGNLAALVERLKSRDSLSLLDFAKRCREGKDALISAYSLPPAAAERLAQAAPDVFMKLEELELPATTTVQLNTSSEGEPETWQTIEALSTGQKATAVLLLLLEAVVNALVHRDYLLSSTDIELTIFDDRMEIVSPGRLPNGITPARMLTGCRATRNQLIKDVMRDYRYLENSGMGIPRKIVKSMREHNGTEPVLIEDGERFNLRLLR